MRREGLESRLIARPRIAVERERTGRSLGGGLAGAGRLSLGVPSVRPRRTGAGPLRGLQVHYWSGPGPFSLVPGPSRASDGFPDLFLSGRYG
jgi:hypothetical protein